ncbi:hypothetical protein E1B28_007486 [Marasmius oreades]|uniref:Uncharacterized protein n=1 Tax=Marasmius oreades TaxID=181124 RepID=A0A9P7S2G2_9AGAR|nr:uncharacterized protein E1B28_007486 [Marasmius oreades]KAG7093847.1 hypothetical protein E1B28_007486 [Marasmius oreades]
MAGYYASDPKCSQYGKPRLFAIAEEDNDRLDNESTTTPELEEPTVPDEQSSEGDYILEPFEDYGGYINDESYDDWMGNIEQRDGTQRPINGPYNLLENCSPPIVIEDGVNVLDFPSFKANQYQTDDRICIINLTESAETLNVDIQLCRSSRPITCLDRSGVSQRRPLVALVEIAGQTALTLFDSSCTLECLSPGVMRLANVKIHQLAEQHLLQLGTVGSRPKFNYGTIVNTEYLTIQDKTYFDIINIDQHDAIVGTYFMQKHGIQLDFKNDQILVNGTVATCLSVGEDAAKLKR